MELRPVSLIPERQSFSNRPFEIHLKPSHPKSRPRYNLFFSQGNTEEALKQKTGAAAVMQLRPFELDMWHSPYSASFFASSWLITLGLP